MAVNEIVNPVASASGPRRCEAAAEPIRIGTSGSTHGESVDKVPAAKENRATVRAPLASTCLSRFSFAAEPYPRFAVRAAAGSDSDRFGAASHRLGPLALATGLTISFTAIGIFVSTLGGALGIDQQVVRVIGAALLIFSSHYLLSSNLQHACGGHFRVSERAKSARQNQPERITGSVHARLLLGIVWSPCVGRPGRCGDACQQGTNLAHTSTVMLLFGLGGRDTAGADRRAFQTSAESIPWTADGVGQAGKKILGTMLAGLACW